MRNKDLKNAYGGVPQGFHNSIIRTLNTLDSGKSSIPNITQAQVFSDFDEESILTIQPKKRGFLKTAGVCILAAAVVIGGVVSAKKVLNNFITLDTGINSQISPSVQPVQKSTADQPETTEHLPEDRKLNLVLTQSENAPVYVKMSVNYLPEGVIDHDDYKYSLNGNREKMCFTIVGNRVVGVDNFTDDDIIGTIINAETLEIGGNTAILANFDADPYSRRFYIFFEDMAVLVTGYVTKDVPDEELRKVMENITVEECAEGEHNLDPLSLAEQFDDYEGKSDNWGVDYKEIWSEVQLGQKIGFDDNLEKLST